jgi:hypothetical protein
MKYLMLVVRLLDMLTGSGFYELTRYSNGTGLNLSTSKFMAWRRRTARRLWSLEAVHMIVPFILIGTLLVGVSPLLAISSFGMTAVFLVVVMALVIFFPPIAILLL